MYKIYGILGAEYPARHGYHLASGAGRRSKGEAPEAKSNFIFWTFYGSGNIMAFWGEGARAPCAPYVDPPMNVLSMFGMLCLPMSSILTRYLNSAAKVNNSGYIKRL